MAHVPLDAAVSTDYLLVHITEPCTPKTFAVNVFSSPFVRDLDHPEESDEIESTRYQDTTSHKNPSLACNTFAIHEDPLSNDTMTIDFGECKIDTSSPSHITPRVQPLVSKIDNNTTTAFGNHTFEECPKLKSVQELDQENLDHANDFDNDYDAPTIVSEDTCFSTFSAIPKTDMTLFANTGNPLSFVSSTEDRDAIEVEKSNARPNSEAKSSPPLFSSSARHESRRGSGNTTNLLLDFTQQFEGFSAPPLDSTARVVRGSPVRMHTDSTVLGYMQKQRSGSPSKHTHATPSRRKSSGLHLLDFELPPQPTPKSIPSITAREHTRELESVKSGYLSEISSLKASLSGRDAEVDSLKKAMGDAERRVAEALETLEDERSTRERLESEREEWEAQRKNIDELHHSLKREVEAMQTRLAESQQAREEAEHKAMEAHQHAAMTSMGNASGSTSDSENIEAIIAQRVGQQMDEKMENLARELHAVYKKKHETKVATLKKTYEARAERKTQELQKIVDEMTERCQGLEASQNQQAKLNQNENGEPQHSTRIADLEAQLQAMEQSQAQLQHELECERAEKGDLVAAVDEMLALQVETAQVPQAPDTDLVDVDDMLRKSVVGSRLLKAPGAPTSRIGRAGASSVPKSRMMSSIERMGSGRVTES